MLGNIKKNSQYGLEYIRMSGKVELEICGVWFYNNGE